MSYRYDQKGNATKIPKPSGFLQAVLIMLTEEPYKLSDKQANKFSRDMSARETVAMARKKFEDKPHTFRSQRYDADEYLRKYGKLIASGEYI